MCDVLIYPGVNIVQDHGLLKSFLFWGISPVDYDCLQQGLQRTSREDLLPPRPDFFNQPLAWWRVLRDNLNVSATSLPLRLSALYWAIFPEDRNTVLRAHSPDADVVMTIRLIQTYFSRALGWPTPGKMENYFRQWNGWRTELEKLKVDIKEQDQDFGREEEIDYHEMELG